MKTISRWSKAANILVSGLVVLLVIACGCATQPRSGIVMHHGPPFSGLIGPRSGAVAILAASNHPTINIDIPPSFVAQSRAERAGEWARSCILPPESDIATQKENELHRGFDVAPDPFSRTWQKDLWVPYYEPPSGPALASAAVTDGLGSMFGIALAPFAATLGALTVGTTEMTQNEISRFHSELVESLTSGQVEFRKMFAKALCRNSNQPVFHVDSWDELSKYKGTVTTVLEVKIDELKLEPVHPRSSSYQLAIRGSLTAFQLPDRRPVDTLPVEYRSEAAPFRDWACAKALQAVAETGYRHMADHLGTNALGNPPSAILLAGTGHGKRLKAQARHETQLAHNRHSSAQRAAFQNVALAPQIAPLAIYPSMGDVPIALQRPVPKDDAVEAAVKDTEYVLDGLHECQNGVVALAAYAAAIPISMWMQTVAIWHNLSAKEVDDAEKKLRNVAYPARMQSAFAQELAMELAPRTSQPVLVLNAPPQRNPSAHTEPGDPDMILPVALRGEQQPSPDTFIEIQLRSAELTGSTEVNPSLTLCVSAEARVLRASDGQEVYRCMTQYRGTSRKFVSWAANNAEPFRIEVRRCVKDIVRKVADELLNEKLIPATPSAASLLASH